MYLSFIWPLKKCRPGFFICQGPASSFIDAYCTFVKCFVRISWAFLKDLCENHNFLCLLKKVNREQTPNLKMVVPFLFNSLLKIIMPWIWRNICYVLERHRNPICLFIPCTYWALCISLCACLCKLVLCLILVLWEMSCACYRRESRICVAWF